MFELAAASSWMLRNGCSVNQGLYPVYALVRARSSPLHTRAALQHNRATLGYSGTVLGRWRELRRKALVAQQELDDTRVAYGASRADVEAAEASVEAIQSRVATAQASIEANRAPSGTATAAPSSQPLAQTTNTPMFKLARRTAFESQSQGLRSEAAS